MQISKQTANEKSEVQRLGVLGVLNYTRFRLVLNHLGYFNPAALKESLTSAMPRVVALSSNQDEFIRDLNAIDEISAKTVDNIFVYYVKNGQKHAHDILNNVSAYYITLAL